MSLRILVVDDADMFREALEGMLALDADLEVVGSASDGGSAIAMAGTLSPDLVLMDLTLPDMSGLEAMRRIRLTVPETAVVVLSGHAGPEIRWRAIAAGAADVVGKNDLGGLMRVIDAAAGHA